jgi:hypothetical protein
VHKHLRYYARSAISFLPVFDLANLCSEFLHALAGSRIYQSSLMEASNDEFRRRGRRGLDGLQWAVAATEIHPAHSARSGGRYAMHMHIWCRRWNGRAPNMRCGHIDINSNKHELHLINPTYTIDRRETHSQERFRQHAPESTRNGCSRDNM